MRYNASNTAGKVCPQLIRPQEDECKHIPTARTRTEITDELRLSSRTIENHRTNICAKLDLHGSHALLKFAFENRSKL